MKEKQNISKSKLMRKNKIFICWRAADYYEQKINYTWPKQILQNTKDTAQ